MTEFHHIETLYTCALSGCLKDLTAKTALEELRRLAHMLDQKLRITDARVQGMIEGISDVVIRTTIGETPEERRANFVAVDGGKE